MGFIHEILMPVGIIGLLGMNYITNIRIRGAEDRLRVIHELICLRKGERIVYEDDAQEGSK